MIKLPEPCSTVGSLLGEVGTFTAMGYKLRRGDGLYTESQLRDYGRAEYLRGLEQCAMLCDSLIHYGEVSGVLCAKAIRALAKEQT